MVKGIFVAECAAGRVILEVPDHAESVVIPVEGNPELRIMSAGGDNLLVAAGQGVNLELKAHHTQCIGVTHTVAFLLTWYPTKKLYNAQPVPPKVVPLMNDEKAPPPDPITKTITRAPAAPAGASSPPTPTAPATVPTPPLSGTNGSGSGTPSAGSFRTEKRPSWAQVSSRGSGGSPPLDTNQTEVNKDSGVVVPASPSVKQLKQQMADNASGSAGSTTKAKGAKVPHQPRTKELPPAPESNSDGSEKKWSKQKPSNWNRNSVEQKSSEAQFSSSSGKSNVGGDKGDEDGPKPARATPRRSPAVRRGPPPPPPTNSN
jgi:hypothetical protein